MVERQVLESAAEVGSVPVGAASLESGSSPPTDLLLSFAGLLSGKEHCLHCPLVERRDTGMLCWQLLQNAHIYLMI